MKIKGKKSNSLREILYKCHKTLIESGETSILSSDTTVICKDGTVRYSKMLISLVDPELSKFIIDDKEDLCFIYPDISKEEFIKVYSLYWKRAYCDQVTLCDSKIHDEVPTPSFGLKETEEEFQFGDLAKEEAINYEGLELEKESIVNLCDLCGAGFLTYDKLIKHRFNVHSEENSPRKSIPCPECKKHFTSQKFLRRHRRTIHTISQCKECFKIFKNLATLQCHNKMHRPDRKQFECSICGKISMKRSNHERHLSVHKNNNTSFHCDICPMTFPLKHNLDRHKLSHHNDLCVFCPKCNRTFKRSDNMKRHLLKCKK